MTQGNRADCSALPLNVEGLVLAHAEWSQWSDREIARRCQVGHGVVSRLRQIYLAQWAR
jgi:hypothetical protein